MNMSKTYFIDSENVGDNWISLLDTVQADDELLVFYTAKSPHMSYKNLILLKQSSKEINFIECYEGKNSLDFQLVTELGYRIHDISDGDYIIISNDTGFDSVVKYWRDRHHSIKRMSGKACKMPVPTTTTSDATKDIDAINDIIATYTDSLDTINPDVNSPDTSNPDVTSPVTGEISTNNRRTDNTKSDSNKTDNTKADNAKTDNTKADNAKADNAKTDNAKADNTKADNKKADNKKSNNNKSNNKSNNKAGNPKEASNDNMDNLAREILYIIGKDNRQALHEALKQLFGEKNGKKYYDAFKSGDAYTKYIKNHAVMSLEEKYSSYCSVAFSVSDSKLTMPNDFAIFVTKQWNEKPNLNSLRASLQTKYGKEHYEEYYSIIKAHIKILTNIK